jgi:argininosuccinate synthase
MKEKIILAYSGGLDTTTIIPWLKENYDYDIIAVCIEVGLGAEDTATLEQRALSSGASKVHIIDAQAEFITDYVYPCLKAGAMYEGVYLLGTAMARPLIAEKLVEVAKQEGAKIICHGATGKGNDQVRFELAIKALAPDFQIIAPWRLWNIKSREDAMAYLAERGIPFTKKKEDSYSRDRNIWHLSHEGLELEDPANAPHYDRLLQLSVSPQKAPDTEKQITLTFEQGLPTHLDGQALGPVEMLEALNAIGGQYGIGIVDMVENRVVGMKSRGIYENPGGAILYKAHELLEQLCLDAKTKSTKQQLALQYAELVYGGLWFTPLREALDAFMTETQKTVTGTVKLTLYKGNIIPAGMTSPYSLYSEALASFTTGELYDHADAQGFITLYGLPSKVRALVMQQAANQQAKAPAGVS